MTNEPVKVRDLKPGMLLWNGKIVRSVEEPDGLMLCKVVYSDGSDATLEANSTVGRLSV